jgi:hypothetical protein
MMRVAPSRIKNKKEQRRLKKPNALQGKGVGTKSIRLTVKYIKRSAMRRSTRWEVFESLGGRFINQGR